MTVAFSGDSITVAHGFDNIENRHFILYFKQNSKIPFSNTSLYAIILQNNMIFSKGDKK